MMHHLGRGLWRAATALALIGSLPWTASAQILQYPDPCLDYVYPAGAQKGQTVTVEFGGLSGFVGATKLIVDGPPGITVGAVKPGDAGKVHATLTIAADAAPGRRWLRMLGGTNGLTNGRPFFVGTLPEASEKEPNNLPGAAQEVTLPVVVNGRIDKALDVDCYKFQAKAGQRLIVAVLGHRMDSTVRVSFNQGFLDTNLELLDDQGKVLAAADDTLGLDPVLDVPIKRDGVYVVRVQTLAYTGSAGSVYRLTLGDVPYPTHVFPAGGQRGATLDATWGGFNLPALKQKLTLAKESTSAIEWHAPPTAQSDGRDFPFVRGAHPETIEQEPNNDAKQAVLLPVPTAVHGRFAAKGDEDWYRVALKKGQGVTLEVTAQRHWRAPVDAVLEVFDAAGKKLAENDDGVLFARPNQCSHEFTSADSWLQFTAPADGDFFVRLRDQANTGAPEAIYRLALTHLQPELKLYQWPDAVPIWGPGGTSCFIVEVFQWGGPKGDVELRVEGLPAGWTGSTTKLGAAAIYAPPYSLRSLLTITAPADAALGAVAEFRVVGKTVIEGRTIEAVAQPQSLYGNSHNDGMLLRYSAISRAVVAAPLDCRLETSIKEITAKHGETVQIPVRIFRKPDSKASLGLVVNGPTPAAGVGLGPPLTIAADQTEIMLPLTINPELAVGTRGIVVARSWSSDIRGGRPGPCTPIILLHIKPK